MLEFLTTTSQFIAISTATYWAIKWRQEDYSWKDVFKSVGASLLNYGFFYYSATLGRLGGTAIYPIISGQPPSALWHPFDALDYYKEETDFVRYTMDYLPYAIIPIGFKVSFEIINLMESLANKVIEKGYEAVHPADVPRTNHLAYKRNSRKGNARDNTELKRTQSRRSRTKPK